MSKIKEYIEETKTEMKHVSWPTRRQAIVFTIGVIVVSFATSFYLGFFDLIFSYILRLFV